MNALPSGSVLLAAAILASSGHAAETVVFWAFDEPVGMYPSSVLSDQGPGDHSLVLGPGGSLVPGRFGNALSAVEQPPIDLPTGSVRFGLEQLPTPPDRTVAPMSWMNARFAALATSGEKHLRQEFAFVNATQSGLNLGAFDWTVEFLLNLRPWQPGDPHGIVFETGEGPRGENGRITALGLSGDRTEFILVNWPSRSEIAIPTNTEVLKEAGNWVHLAFTFEAKGGRLRHFVDGQLQADLEPVELKVLDEGEEAYFSLLRDGAWAHSLPGSIDEFRISRGLAYTGEFDPSGSLVEAPDRGGSAQPAEVKHPLLFAAASGDAGPVNLGGRKHLLIDDALFPVNQGVTFRPVPPERVELVFEVEGSFRKHLTVIEDDEGRIRIYNPIGRHDRLGVRISNDGVNFEVPELSEIEEGYPNIMLADSTGTPSVFIDPLAPPKERWKMVSGSSERGIYLFTSPDGFDWTRCPTAVLSSWSGSQTNMFYDDQRGIYVGYHRTDLGDTPTSKTERRFVMTEVDELTPPWPFEAVSQAEYNRVAQTSRLDRNRPWYLDNGPLTPGGIGIEYPTVFCSIDGFDPESTDIYVPKAVKYPWASDAYLAFPCIYYHYIEAGPPTRQALAEESRKRGSGPIEIQLMASRNGVDWVRYPRPIWHNIGPMDGMDIHQTYIAHGMIRRGDEIWQYSFNTEEYHSSYREGPDRRGVFRMVSRVDRFVAAEAPYDTDAVLHSQPLVFTGKRLSLNVDTGASGYLQVGIAQGNGRPLPGFDLEDCVYVNGNQSDAIVEWLESGSDLSALAGQPIRLVIRMRGTRLYALQFVE